MRDDEQPVLARPARTPHELREAARRARASQQRDDDTARRFLDEAEHLPAAGPEVRP